MLKLFMIKNFRWLWLSGLTSGLGDGVTRITLTLYISLQLQDPIIISLILIGQILPMIVLGAFSGSLADRYRKKPIMMFSHLFRAGILILMIVFQANPYVLIGLIFFQGIGSAFFNPAYTAILPKIVEKKDIRNVFSLSESTSSAIQLIGPAIGGFIFLHTTSMDVILKVNVVTFLCSVLFLSFLKVEKDISDISITKGKSDILIDIKEGFLFLRGNNLLKYLLLMMTSVTFFVGIINTNAISAFLFEFRLNPQQFGLVEAIVGVGSLAGAMASSFILSKIDDIKSLNYAAILISLLCVVLYLLKPVVLEISVFPLYLWCVCLGFMVTFINIPLNTLLVNHTPEEKLGRISASFDISSYSMMILGLFLGGWIASLLDTLISIVIAGISFLLTCSFMYYWKSKASVDSHKAGGEQVEKN